MRTPLTPIASALLILAVHASADAQDAPALQRPPGVERAFADPAAYLPEVPLVPATSELRDLVMRYAQDRQALQRFYTVRGSEARRARLREFNRAWLAHLPKAGFATLSHEGQLDYVLLRNEIENGLALLDREERMLKDTAPLVPFADAIARLQEDRQALTFITPEEALKAVQDINVQVAAARAAVEAGTLTSTPVAAFRAAQQVEQLRGALRQWYAFYYGYDPGFTIALPAPHDAAASALTEYAALLRERLVDWPKGADEPIVGNPIGRQGLMEDLRAEFIPYTPEQLIEIGTREYAWIENEMTKASLEMGFGDDWHAALDRVKNMYVPEGEQPELIRNLALEAEAYLKQHDLVTIPPLASDSWKMNMMSPERQKVNPFFTGGETISVSYPHVSMAEEDQRMSLRGNGIHVSRATVHHELIPGHHLQGFMSNRYNAHRTLFDTPFMTEGWALYWEMLLWDHGFARSPEDRLGMLWWRMHRATRIIFSLNFHLGNWTPEQAISFLVEKGRHDRFTATGEVRRSFNSTYSPLYQIAYMIGGLQIRSMYKELVETEQMSAKDFHDAILRQGEMPIELMRAALTDAPLTAGYQPTWQFYGDVAGDVALAKAIHERVITLDTHDDINPANFTAECNYTQRLTTQVNLPKMNEGGLDVAFFIVYVGQGPLTADGYDAAYRQAVEKFDAIHRLTNDIAPDQIALALTPADVRRIVGDGKKAAVIGIENGYAIGTDAARVQEFYDRGGRYMSLAHNGHSQLSDSNTGEASGEWLHGGLSDLGREVIAEMNRLGMMIDISHPSKQANLQTMALSKAPVIASHSAARALANHSRNLDDEQLMALKKNGGVVQTVAFASYVNATPPERNAAVARLNAEFGVSSGRGRGAGPGAGAPRPCPVEGTPAAQARRGGGRGAQNAAVAALPSARRAAYARRMAAIDRLYPVPPRATVADFVNHIDYLVKTIGIDHVGISSDFDGGGGVIGWASAAESPNVTLELVRRGYTEEQIGKLWSGNLLRVWEQVQDVAEGR